MQLIQIKKIFAHLYCFKLQTKALFILLLLFSQLVTALPTTLSGQNYVDQCASHDVPTPTWSGSQGGFGWNRIGEIGDESLPGAYFNTTFNASLDSVIFTYESDNPSGTCLALRRPDFGSIGLDHIDVICLGITSSKACFWEGIEIDENLTGIPLSEFNGGQDLLETESDFIPNCSSCHAGRNPFIIHPGTPLSNPSLGDIQLNSLERYDPILPIQMSQNSQLFDVDSIDFDALIVLDLGELGIEIDTNDINNFINDFDNDVGCFSCHRDVNLGGVGRFPKILSQVNFEWCKFLLDRAAEETMPPLPPNPGGIAHISDPIQREIYQSQKNILRAMCLLSTSSSPQIRIEETKLEFGDVQLGYSHAKALVIHNDGDAFLKFSVTSYNRNTAWSQSPSVTDVVINPGDEPVVLTYVFTPENVGPQELILKVYYTGQNIDYKLQNITLKGLGVAPFPFDTTLLLDRSGSMADDLAGRDKILAMRIAVNLYADLLRENIDYNNSIGILDFAIGDRLGMVKYNEQNQILFPLETIQGGQRISEADINDLAILAPTGLTGIGGAMIRAANMLLTAEPNTSDVTPLLGMAKQIMIVLTDGKENTAPFIDDVIGSIQALNPKLLTYSIGIGTDVNANKLQSISNVSDGYHQIISDFSGLGLFGLEDFYFKIFVDAREHDILFFENSPAMTLGVINITTPQTMSRLNVDASTREINFLIMDDPAMRIYYTLELIAPNGEVVTDGFIQGVTTAGYIYAHGFEAGEISENTPTRDLEINSISHDTYKIVNVKFIGNERHSQYFGEWSLRLTPNGFWPQIIEPVVSSSQFNYSSNGTNPFAGFVPIGFRASVGSNFRLDAQISATNYELNSTLTLTASLSDRQLAVTDGSVIVTITKPFGSISSTPIPFDIQLYDDATHGDLFVGDGTWTNEFDNTNQLGVYQFVFKASGTNSHGKIARRQASKYTTISRSE